jgi:hypothetical protein
MDYPVLLKDDSHPVWYTQVHLLPVYITSVGTGSSKKYTLKALWLKFPVA